MAMIGEWVRRLHYLFRRRAIEEDLRREMEGHRELMDDPAAFGNILRLRDEARDAWGWRWLDDLARDARIALRTLRATPGFALTAVATLALGIGVNTGMFTVVSSVLLRPLLDRPTDVVGIYSRSTDPSRQNRGISYPNYLDLREATAGLFENLAAVSTVFVGLDAGDGARRTLASGVTADYFRIFDRPLALGRPFTADEERPGAGARVAIVSFSLWQQRGADPAIINQPVRINGETFTLVGVTAEGFTGTSLPGPDVWLPLGADATATASAHVLSVVGRLRAGTPAGTVAPALATISSRLEQAFPASNAGYTFEASPPSRLLFMPGAGSGALTALAVLLMLMPATVLLVACLNLANLMLTRGHVRRQELAIRSSLGGGRWRLTRQLLTEGVLLACAGAAAGLVLSAWAIDALLASLRPMLPVALTLPELDLDWRVLGGTVGFSLAAALVFGAWPAWDLTGRAAAAGLERRGSDDGRQPRGIRIGNALVVVQIALSLLLLASGGLFLMSAIAAGTADPGFRLEGGVLAEVDPSLTGYDDARARQFHLAAADRLRAVSGVEAVTIASDFPFTGTGNSRVVAPAGGSAAAPVDARFVAVGRGYPETLGLAFLSGRDFSDAEVSPGPHDSVAMVDDALAQRLWPGESALGRLIRFQDDGAAVGPMRVVGVVPAVNHSLGNPRPFPHVYVPLGQHDAGAMTLMVRAAAGVDESAILAAAARAIREVDARVPVLRLETWRAHIDAGLEAWLYRAAAKVCSAFGAIALLLAFVGVYGVKSYVVTRRTREFGIRIAVGAHPRVLLWQVVAEGGRIAAAGILIGLLLALGAGRVLRNFLYGIESAEPVVLVTAPLVLILASLLASFLPALRATRVDPTIALRSE